LVATGDVKIRRYPPYSDDNLFHTAHAGERLDVDGCESTKSDIIVRVRLPNGALGYASSGPYRLERQGFGLEWILRHPERGVLSCRNMFWNISKEMTSATSDELPSRAA
jgi:hypothetical protein